MFELILFLSLSAVSIFIAKRWIFRRSKWNKGVNSFGIHFDIKKDRPTTLKLGMIGSLAFFLLIFNIESIKAKMPTIIEDNTNAFSLDDFDLSPITKKSKPKPKINKITAPPEVFKPKIVDQLTDIPDLKMEIKTFEDIDPEDLEDEEYSGEPEVRPPNPFPMLAAEFPNGFGAFSKYVQNNLSLPSAFIEEGKSKKVYVKVIFDHEGNITFAKLANGDHINKDLEKNVLKTIRNSPKWNPGISYDSIPIPTSQTIPINIRIQ